MSQVVSRAAKQLNIFHVQGGQEYAKRTEARELAAAEKEKTKADKSE